MESEAAAALAAAVVVEAAAATVETAALVGEAAAAAEEEEGEAAAAAKGKRTALPGLGGIPSPGSPLSSPHPLPPLRLEGASLTRRALAGRPLLPLTLPPSASFLPQWRGRVGGPPSPPDRVGVGSLGPGLGSGEFVCRGRGAFIGVGSRGEPRVGEGARGWGGPLPAPVPPARPSGMCELGVGEGKLLFGEP